MLIRYLPYFSDDDDGGAAGEDGGKVRASDLRSQLGMQVDEQALMRLLEKQAELLTDNSKLREQRRTLRQEVTDLKGKQTPEAARVLTADEAALWDAYQALGAPDEVKQRLETSAGAAERLAGLERSERIRAAAEAAGFKPSVLTTLAGSLDIQVKQTKEGKPLPVVVEEGKETALADYATQHWGDFLPALTPGTAGGAPDINAGARGNGHAPLLSDEDREKATRRYRATF